MADRHARTVRLEGGDVVLEHAARGEGVRFALDALLAVGERTDASGPYGDDWVVVLVARDGTWLEIPTEAGGFDAWWAELARVLGPLELALGNSTSLASRIVWPPALAGERLFDFEPLPVAGWRAGGVRGLGARLRRWWSEPHRAHLSAELLARLERAAREDRGRDSAAFERESS